MFENHHLWIEKLYLISKWLINHEQNSLKNFSNPNGKPTIKPQNRAHSKSSMCSILQPYCDPAFWDLEILKLAFFCLMGKFWYLESNWEFFFSFSFHIHRTPKFWIFFWNFFFSEIPLTNKMYPKTTNENHFQTCLIQGWPTIQLKNGAYALFYCLIVGQPLKVKYLSDT